MPSVRVPIPFVGPAYEARSPQISAQRCVNCYVETAGVDGAPTALIGTPGLKYRGYLNDGPVRGCHTYNDNGTITTIWVSGDEVFVETGLNISKAGGNLLTSEGPVGIAAGSNSQLIVDGVSGYYIENESELVGSLVAITDEDFPKGVTVACYIDGYFIVSGDGTQAFYINQASNDPTLWNGLDFASAEGAPDSILAIAANQRELWLFGGASVEVWINTGDAGFPFERSNNVFIQTGIHAPLSLVRVGDSLAWLGIANNSSPAVFITDGYTPRRISTAAIEYQIQKYCDISDAFGMTYQLEGHQFYILTFPTGNETWVYDLSTGFWHQRAWFDGSDESLHAWRPTCCAYNVVPSIGDASGCVYDIDPCYYYDDIATMVDEEVSVDPGAIKRIRSSSLMQDKQLIQFASMIQIVMGDNGACRDCDPDPT